MEIKTKEFIRKLRKYGRKNGFEVIYDEGHGKGSHGRVYLGGRFTTVKGADKTIREGLLRKMCKDLGIGIEDL